MRTSNKILLGVFLAPVIVISSIHLALYTKYRSGNYVNIRVLREEEFTRHDFKNIHYIEASGLDNFRIIPADSLGLKIEKQGYIQVRFSVVGDRLLIQGDSAIVNTRKEQDKQIDTVRSSREVTLYLPSIEKITVNNSNATLKVIEDSNYAKSYSFEFGHGASFNIEENEHNDTVYHYINSLSILAANASSIELFSSAHIKELKLRLIDSKFDDKNAIIDKIGLDADGKSTLSLTGENLNKVNKGKQD